jgi:hypothetical protein
LASQSAPSRAVNPTFRPPYHTRHTPSLGLIVHHTDGEREAAYDRESHFGKLDQALDDAPSRGWVVVDMKKDWKRVFPE